MNEMLKARLQAFAFAVEMLVWLLIFVMLLLFASFVSYQWGYETHARGEPSFFRDISEDAQ